jgi:hypothetical protein
MVGIFLMFFFPLILPLIFFLLALKLLKSSLSEFDGCTENILLLLGLLSDINGLDEGLWKDRM